MLDGAVAEPILQRPRIMPRISQGVTNVQVYFCDRRSPWQRGSNENTNGLLRQYLPRGTDFSRISQSYLDAIALRLNQRPRKTLGFQTPADRLQRCCTDRLNAQG
jgi:IS30 family transposase